MCLQVGLVAGRKLASSPQGCGTAFITWQLPIQWAPPETKANVTRSFMTSLQSHTPLLLQNPSDHIGITVPIDHTVINIAISYSSWRGLHNGMNIRRQGSLRTFWRPATIRAHSQYMCWVPTENLGNKQWMTIVSVFVKHTFSWRSQRQQIKSVSKL